MRSIKNLGPQILSYGIVGSFGLMTHSLIMKSGQWLQIDLNLTLAAAIVISTSQNFVFNRIYTFRAVTDGHSFWIQYFKYWSATGFGALLSFFLGSILLKQSSFLEAHPQWIGFVCIPVAILFNFALNRSWTFAQK